MQSETLRGRAPQGEPKLGGDHPTVRVLCSDKWLYPSLMKGLGRFWLRAIKVSSPAAQERFIASFSEYVYAVIDEASDRAKGHIRSVEDYLELTRLTAGGVTHRSCRRGWFGHSQRGHGAPRPRNARALAAESLSSQMFVFSTWVALRHSSDSRWAGHVLVPISNKRGHGGHHVITVIMNEKEVDLDGAIQMARGISRRVLSSSGAAQYALRGVLRSIADVGAFVERLVTGSVGIDSWSLETERYFGTKGQEVQNNRLVTCFQR